MTSGSLPSGQNGKMTEPRRTRAPTFNPYQFGRVTVLVQECLESRNCLRERPRFFATHWDSLLGPKGAADPENCPDKSG